jgi:hypothetical protein
VTDDSCPQTFSTENLGHELAVAGLSFGGFSEDMPTAGFTGCASGNYARKHNPWADFTNVPASANMTFASLPSNYITLPTVSFVVPNLCDDMHDCDVGSGDSWLQANIDGYVQWAKSHNSLLVLTWDEDDNTGGNNHIPTIFVGAGVTPGTYGETISHYSVLRTIEDMYGLGYAGNSANATPITDIWSAGSGGSGTGSGQILGSLLREITPRGKAARISALLKKSGYVLPFTALRGGKVVINWYYLPNGAQLASGKLKPVLVAAGNKAFSRAGTLHITIKLTANGKRLLKHSKKRKLTAQGKFTTIGEQAVVATQAFTLTR